MFLSLLRVFLDDLKWLTAPCRTSVAQGSPSATAGPTSFSWHFLQNLGVGYTAVTGLQSHVYWSRVYHGQVRVTV